ncbi:period circadian protein homolog 2 isoform X1 [Scleropages formosus]|uniref:Period circadian protein homolog 2 n=1 Tax=Scleropages formosus TaxID=113540 RepID=A0A8C9RWE8_SCLFO|nr:period circadian protein homolog 2-like isoform X1 [Scleropages formosus]
MAEGPDTKRYLFASLEGSDAYALNQQRRMSGFGDGHGLASEGSDSSQEPSASPHGNRQSTHSLHEDVEMNGSGTESHGNESNGSSNGNGKDSALLESSGSNKSSNSHSPSPPSSSNAFSLLSASSEQDNPSTSGCSSEQSAKAKTQKELFRTLKKLKVHLPSEKRNKGKSSTLNTLKYALRCVKQVKANEEYYQMLMTNENQPPGLDVSSYTIAEIDSITSEYTLKNTDIFAVAVSLITGKIVYISDQAASILNCKRDVFKNAKFVEFLTPQDVSVFYSFTTPYRLPSWSMCTGADSSPSDCMQEKSFFCRISGGKQHEGDLQYYPFRMTPYLMKVQDTEDQICCLLLAERVHSGYEAPRIPTDKRIFTTTHTPNCVFQDVDERAVPLLGYLPQDLIGTPVLLHLHPNDRPLMLAVHRKILQYMGQPFDHSSIRFCTRNGEYVTLDTSWSSFVNPWSRKVSFVIGRHKVRMGPVNEDVFAAPAFTESKIVDSDIQEVTEQIHKLLLQPVHNLGSSGYSSLGSNGSHEQLVTAASSSEGNGHGSEEMRRDMPRSFQEICKGVHMKNNDQIFMGSSSKSDFRKNLDRLEPWGPAVRPKESSPSAGGKEGTAGLQDRTAVQEELTCKDQTVYSYQQISCLDSVIRYLESCNIPITVKRKCHSSSNTTSSNSDEDKQKGADISVQESAEHLLLDPQPGVSALKDPLKPAGPVVGGSLTPLALPSKAESVVSITSQCSYSSTIVHVGDKKPQPESEIIEDVAESPAPAATLLPPLPPTPSQEREPYKKVGLTKQVLAAHTQKEEQAFLSRCREQLHVLSLQTERSLHLPRHRGQPGADGTSGVRGTKEGGAAAEPAARKGGRNKKSKKPRMKMNESSDSTESHRKQQQSQAPLLLRPPLQGLNQTSWSPSETSQSTYPVAYPAVVPAYPLPVYPGTAAAVPPAADARVPGMGENQGAQDPRFPMQPSPYPAPLVTPVMAFFMPNYVFPTLGGTPQTPFPAQPAFPAQHTFIPQTTFPMQQPFPNQHSLPGGATFPVQTVLPPQPFNYGVPPEPPKAPTPELRDGLSGCSTPPSAGRDQATPPLFESRCSSPLQLNLLQLEEMPRSVERQDGPAPPVSTQGGVVGEKGVTSSTGQADKVLQQVGSPDEGQQSDACSSSSDLMDILLQEDSRSAAGSATSGSATSGSLGSGSNGCGTSGTGSSQTSNTSKYFGSIDSSENDHKGKPGTDAEDGHSVGFAKYVLQEPIWLLMANADESVMMTYQLPSRDAQKVLKEDRERLRQMQKSQPRFTEEQKEELAEVHPWVKKGGLPKAINLKKCMCCEDRQPDPIEEELPDMELTTLGETIEDNATRNGHEEAVLMDPAPLLCKSKGGDTPVLHPTESSPCTPLQ